jgi:hypothetical protein
MDEERNEGACALKEQGFLPGSCLISATRKETLACQATLRKKDFGLERLISAVHLSRPENYLSIYQSGCNFSCRKCDDLVKSLKRRISVIPAKAGIQLFQILKNSLDSGFHRSDDFLRDHQVSFLVFQQEGRRGVVHTGKNSPGLHKIRSAGNPSRTQEESHGLPCS